jgi:thiol-disulfide isomerase/thioredoxin
MRNGHVSVLAQGFLGSLVLAIGVTMEVARADQIRLQDGTELSATLVGRDGESLILRLPRKAVASVNGQTLPPPVTEGSPAPVFTAKDRSGVTYTVPAADRPATLVQFWATWCPHCRADLALMKRLSDQYQEQGLRLVTVSVDQDLAALDALIEREQVAYPVISAVTYPELPDRYETQGVPAYYLIASNGTIAKTWQGSITEGRAEAELESALARLLAKPEI